MSSVCPSIRQPRHQCTPRSLYPHTSLHLLPLLVPYMKVSVWEKGSISECIYTFTLALWSIFSHFLSLSSYHRPSMCLLVCSFSSKFVPLMWGEREHMSASDGHSLTDILSICTGPNSHNLGGRRRPTNGEDNVWEESLSLAQQVYMTNTQHKHSLLKKLHLKNWEVCSYSYWH